MAHTRPTASDDDPPALIGLDGGRSDAREPRLTSAEARALRRTDRLTQADLERHFEGMGEPPQRPA